MTLKNSIIKKRVIILNYSGYAVSAGALATDPGSGQVNNLK